MRHQRLFKTITIWCHRTEFLERIENMKTEDILRMAQEAKFFVKDNEAYSPSSQEDHELTEHLERFANLVAAAEREACANIAKEESMRGLPKEMPKGKHLKTAIAQIVSGTVIAEAIRSRGQA